MALFVAQAIEIMPVLWDRYGGFLRHDLAGVRILHKNGICYLEITTRRGEGETDEQDEVVERINLTAIDAEAEYPTFPGHVSAFITARKFVEEFSEYDIINCTPLFRPEVAELIDIQHRRGAGQDAAPGTSFGDEGA